MAPAQLPSPSASLPLAENMEDSLFQKKTNDDYVLGRSHAANARSVARSLTLITQRPITLVPYLALIYYSFQLNLQHYLWREILGYAIHPSIPLEKPDIRIADIGSGTGQWLFELADRLPSTAVLHGYDLDHAQCMPRGWHPSNVAMHCWDATTPPPREDYYDIIQIRLFIFVVKGNDPRVVLNGLLRMLRPGGHIQWLEPDFQTLHFATTSLSIPATYLPALEAATISSDPRLRPTWVSSLASHFSSAGMHNVVEERKYGPRHTWYAYNSCVLMAREEVVAQKLREGKMDTKRARELMEMVDKAAEEARQGASYVIERVCVVGKKPTRNTDQADVLHWYQRSMGDLLGRVRRPFGWHDRTV